MLNRFNISDIGNKNIVSYRIHTGNTHAALHYTRSAPLVKIRYMCIDAVFRHFFSSDTPLCPRILLITVLCGLICFGHLEHYSDLFVHIV